MTQQTYIAKFKELQEQELELTVKKNADYANSDDAFLNFNLIATLTHGDISTESGMLVRLSDKFQRVANLLSKEAVVVNESIFDTLQDLSNYANILHIYLEDKNRNGITYT